MEDEMKDEERQRIRDIERERMTEDKRYEERKKDSG